MKKVLFILCLLPISMSAQIDSLNKLTIFIDDTTVRNTVTNYFIYTYELTTPESFSIRSSEIDKTTTDSICDAVDIVTIQLKRRKIKKIFFPKYKRIKEADEPEIKALIKFRNDIDAEIKRFIEVKKKSKAQ